MEELISLTEGLTDQELTNYVDWLRTHMKDRANRRNAKAKALVQVGDKVIFAGKLKPQYLIGLTGVVTEKRQSRILVKLDCGPVKKFRSGEVLANPSSLEVIK
jgi:hypothetical protein